MALTITDVRVIVTAPQGVNLVTVKVETSEPGLYGVGCATFTQRHLAVVTAIEEYLRPYLIGKDPQRIEDLWQSMTGMNYWRNGPVLNNAISGVDMALWDIKGKLAGMPLYQLIGGKCREGVAAYTHTTAMTLEEELEKVAEYREKGYQYLRVQIGAYGGKNRRMRAPEGALDGAYFDPKAYMRETMALLEAVRDRFGWELEICHDVHERLSGVDAMNLAKDVEKYKLFFLEDILSPEQVGWFKHIRANCVTPLAMGELFNNPNEWLEIVSERLIDFIRVHLSQIGGITPSLKLRALCDAYGVRTAWHGPPDLTPIGHAVNVHLDISSPNFGIQEWTDNDAVAGGTKALMEEMFPGMPECRQGYLYLNDKPGIGVDINEELAKKYEDAPRSSTKWMLTRLPDGTAVRP